MSSKKTNERINEFIRARKWSDLYAWLYSVPLNNGWVDIMVDEHIDWPSDGTPEENVLIDKIEEEADELNTMQGMFYSLYNATNEESHDSVFSKETIDAEGQLGKDAWGDKTGFLYTMPAGEFKQWMREKIRTMRAAREFWPPNETSCRSNGYSFMKDIYEAEASARAKPENEAKRVKLDV